MGAVGRLAVVVVNTRQGVVGVDSLGPGRVKRSWCAAAPLPAC